MGAVRRIEEAPSLRQRPATTPEGREDQLIAMAVDVAAQQMADGTVSAQVLTHYLKLGSTREKLEQEKLRRENLLLESRANAIESGARVEELMTEAMRAFRGYSGNPDPEDVYDH